MARAHVEVPLTQGKVALVDVDDYDAVRQYRWWAHHQERGKVWYAQRAIRYPDGRRSSQRMHRFVLPNVTEVDHINENGLDNRRANLRPANRSQNSLNVARRRSNTSGYIGVYWHKASGKWVARATRGRKMHYAGSFDDPSAAARARDALALKLHGPEFVTLNFEDVA